ncbi:MAG TPA: MFS transporter [Gaiellales bacterium]|jgi:MFS family permease|nr:MFS transporter [Gaiellales bacterium]
MAADPRIVRRSTVLLAATLTCLSGMLQLVAAVATTTLVLVTGIESILGLGPAVFLAAAAFAALPAGRAMDRFGRVPVLAGGCVAGVAGCCVTAAGAAADTALLVIPGFVLVGSASGIVLLARAAAADLNPPERRARGISLVLVGALPGAALGPLVYGPLFAGRHLTADALVVPYLVAGAIMAVGLVLVLQVRPDPMTYATAVHGAGAAPAKAAPLREILARPGVPAAVTAAVASFAVMVSVMNLSGYVIVGHGHAQDDVFTVISAHIVGMYALVLVIGDVIDRMGRRFALVGGLSVQALSTFALTSAASVPATSVCLFGLGIGWNLAYVAAAAELADVATPSERGRLLGFTDLLSGVSGAGLALAGGAVYAQLGVVALALGATAVAMVPVAWMVARPSPVVGEAGEA